MILYTVIIRYSKPKEEVLAVVDAHRSYLDLFVGGMLLASGPVESGDGGILWVRANSREEVQEMIAKDPYVLADVAHYTVLVFEVKKLAPGLSDVLLGEGLSA